MTVSNLLIVQVRQDVGKLIREKYLIYGIDLSSKADRRWLRDTIVARIGWEVGDKPMSFIEALQRGRRHLYDISEMPRLTTLRSHSPHPATVVA